MNIENRILTALAPAADVFSGTVVTAPINMSKANNVCFQLVKGVGATGISTITVEKCDDASGTNPVAIPFNYRRITGAGFTPGAWQKATASGFNTVAGSNEIYEIQVSGNWEGVAAGDKSFARLKAVEVVDSAVAGMVLAVIGESRYGYNTNYLTA